MDRPVLKPERSLFVRLVRDDQVRPAILVHVRDRQIIVRLRLRLGPFELRPRETALAVAQQQHDLALRRPRRIDDVRVTVAVEVPRTEADHRSSSRHAHDRRPLRLFSPETDPVETRHRLQLRRRHLLRIELRELAVVRQDDVIEFLRGEVPRRRPGVARHRTDDRVARLQLLPLQEAAALPEELRRLIEDAAAGEVGIFVAVEVSARQRVARELRAGRNDRRFFPRGPLLLIDERAHARSRDDS